MTCNIEATLTDLLIKKKFINEDNEVLEISEKDRKAGKTLVNEVSKLTDYAVKKYSLLAGSKKLFFTRKSYSEKFKLYGNPELLNELQRLIDKYDQKQEILKTSIVPAPKTITLEFNSSYDENSIHLDIMSDDLRLGSVNYALDNGIATVDAVEIDLDYRNQGIASRVYGELAVALNKNNIILRSGNLNENSTGLWNSLVKKGLAKEIAPNVFEYLSNSTNTLFQLNTQNLEPAIQELDTFLLDFLKPFGVRSKEFEELKSRLGVDALGATDVLNKLIWYTKNRNVETIPEEVGHMITMLMGEHNPIMKDLLNDIENWSEYTSIKERYMPIYNNEKQVKIEAVGKLIAKALVKNYKVNGLNKSLLQKAIDAIEDFIEKLFGSLKNNLIAQMQYSEKLADHIAINVLMGDRNYIAKLNTSFDKLSYDKALAGNKFAQHIIKTFTDLNAKLTGSLAIAGQGDVIYRSSEEPIHDIDFNVNSKEDYENMLEKVESINGVPYHYGWDNSQKDYTTYAFLIPKEGYTIEVLARDFNKGNGWITEYNVKDEKGNIVEKTSQNHVAVDFFVYKNGEYKGISAGIFKTTADIFKGKLTLSPLGNNERMFARPKDQQDYVLSKPVGADQALPEFTYYQLNNQDVPIVEINLDIVQSARSKEIAEILAKKLSSAMNVDYYNVTPQEAMSILENSTTPYNGESAFFFGGAIYTVGDRINVRSVLHEFSHPLVSSLRKTNPVLFNTLYNQLAETPEGQFIIEHVKKLYPELEEHSPLFMEEALVFSLQLKAINNINEQIESEGFESFINKLLAAIKQLLRGVFGEKVNVKNLSSETTLDELAEMLLEKDFEFDTDMVSEEDLVMYYRDVVERANELVKHASPEAMQNIVNEVYSVGKSTINEAREFAKRTDKVSKALLDKAIFKEGTTELLPAVAKGLKGFQNITPTHVIDENDMVASVINTEEKILELARIKATALVNSMDRMRSSSVNIINELDSIRKNPSLINNRHIIALLGLYKSTANSWISTVKEINDILDEFDLDTSNIFYQTVNEILNNSQRIITKIGDIYKENNVQFFVEITGYMSDFVTEELKTNLGNALEKIYPDPADLEVEVKNLFNKVVDQKDITADLERYHSKGIPVNVLNRFINQYNQYVLNPEKIKDILTGKTKDVSWFNRWLESYSSSNDPIVGSLSMFIQNQKTEVENEVWNKSQKFRAKLAELLPKVNFSKLNSTQLRDMMASKDTIMYYDKETGKPVPKEVYTFLNEFGNGWRYQQDILEYEYEDAKKSGDKVKASEALTKLREFNKAYMWQEYVPEFYEKDEIFNQSIEGKYAYMAKKEAFDKFITLQNQFEKELERFENYSSIKEAYRTYEQLYSLVYEDGTPKVDNPAEGTFDKSIAEILIQHRKDSSHFYEWVPIPNSLSTAYNEFIIELEAKQVDEEEFQKQLKDWEKQNIKVVYADAFYEKRTMLLDKLNEIQAKMKAQMNLEFDVAGAYKAIGDLIYTYRDEFGQPDTTQLGETRIQKIKDLEQSIIDFREKFDMRNGLKAEDSESLRYLLQKSKEGELNHDEAVLLAQLIDKQKEVGIDINLVDTMLNIFSELSELSSKVPTEYYLNAINTRLSKFDVPQVTDESVDSFINSDAFDAILDKDPEFAKWFAMNHVSVKRYDKGKEILVYQRSTANSVIKPNNPDHFKTTTIINNQTGEEIVLNGVPNIRHSRREVKNQYRTVPRGESREQYIGKYVDNKGNFLPRTYEHGNKYSAKDDTYIDKRYQALKARPDSAEFELLETMKEFHLDNQKGGSNYGKLYLDIPRYSTERGDIYQVFQKGQYGERFKNIRGNIKEWIKQSFTESAQDNLNGFNYNPENNLVNTDLQGNEISYIPVTGIYNLDAEVVDADILNNMFKYSLSLQTQSQLLKSLPLVNSVLDTLEDPANQPKNMSKWQKQAYNTKKKLLNVTSNTATNNRLGQVRSLIEREYFGRQVVGIEENHPRLSKWMNNLTKWSSRSSLMMNIPSDLKNQFAGYIQTIIETSGGRFITHRDLALSTSWATKAMLDWSSNGIYTTGPGNLSTQMIQIFDPNFKVTDEYGKTISRSLFKDLINGDWMYMHRKFGEMDVAMRLFGAFLHGQKIEQTLADGTITNIRYVDAWEQDSEGIARLKKGIHPGWNNLAVYHTYTKGETLESIAKQYNVTVEELKAKNHIKSDIQLIDGQEIVIAKSEFYKQFKNRLQGTSRALFGVYDEFGQPEGNKLILYRMFFFMRKWFTPMFVNRFGMDTSKENFGGARYDWALGKPVKGYYVSAFQTITRLIKSKGAEYNFLTDEEKSDFKRMSAEGLIVITTSLLASMLFGYEDGDPDKWKKVQERSGPINSEEFDTYGFLVNHALLLLLGLQAETGAFIPLPKLTVAGQSLNLGADDYAKLLTSTTTAFGNTLLTYTEILGDILNFITFNEGARYSRDAGPYWYQKEGELKIYKRALTILGFSGGTGDPETLLKNLAKGAGRIR